MALKTRHHISLITMLLLNVLTANALSEVEEKLLKLENLIKVLNTKLIENLANLQKQINEINATIKFGVTSALNVNHRKDVKHFNITENLVNKFFYMTQKIETCAVPPSIKAIPENLKVTIIERENLRLECDSSGHPKPTINWTSPDSQIISISQSVLNVKNISRHQAGVYSCVSNNDVGPPQTKRFDVQVHHKPEVFLSDYVNTGTGQDVDLVCVVQSNPTPTIVWTKNEVKSLPPPTLQKINNTFTQSTLTVRITSESYLGWYECRATNSFGNDSAKIEVGGSEPFDFKIIHIDESDYKTYKFLISATSYSPILEYKFMIQPIQHSNWIDYTLKPQYINTKISNGRYHQTVVMLDKETIRTSYAFKILALNEFGWGNTNIYSINNALKSVNEK